uniref:Antibiotic biosynthesis monooxygenase n=1 Tax=Streptomyces sp. NBC_00049 TaxID=2903617 RepID=A0AAU2JRG5_9ACTN
MSIHITVLFTVVPDRLDASLTAFRELATHTRTEKGALRFDAFVAEEHADTVVLVEEWADQEAIDLHMKEPWTAEFLERVEGAFAGSPQVYRIRPLDA